MHNAGTEAVLSGTVPIQKGLMGQLMLHSLTSPRPLIIFFIANAGTSEVIVFLSLGAYASQCLFRATPPTLFEALSWVLCVCSVGSWCDVRVLGWVLCVCSVGSWCDVRVLGWVLCVCSVGSWCDVRVLGWAGECGWVLLTVHVSTSTQIQTRVRTYIRTFKSGGALRGSRMPHF